MNGRPPPRAVDARSSAAASQESVSVITLAMRQAASGSGLPFGMAHAEPDAVGDRLALRSRTVSKAIGASGETSLSTLTYHCSIGIAPSVPLANWLPSPKKSAESRSALTSPKPPWAS